MASQKPPGRTLGSAGVHLGRAVLRGESQEERARLCCRRSDATASSTLELDLLGPCLLQALPSSLYLAYCNDKDVTPCWEG